MPCVALPRGGRATPPQFPAPPGFFTPFANPGHVPPFNDVIDNNPCGKPIVSAVAGVDVSAESLCLPHYTAKYGQAAVPKGGMGGNDASTVLLLHADSTVDEKGHPFSTQGNVTIDQAQAKYGGSFLFAGGYLFSPDSPDWSLGGGDFTIDFWVRFTAVAVPQVIVGQRATNDFAWTVTFISPGNIRFMWTADGVNAIAYAPAWTPTAGTWYHIALVRSGTILRFFVNGAQVGADGNITQVIWDASGPLQVGAELGGSTVFGGNLDELRIS